MSRSLSAIDELFVNGHFWRLVRARPLNETEVSFLHLTDAERNLLGIAKLLVPPDYCTISRLMLTVLQACLHKEDHSKNYPIEHRGPNIIVRLLPST